MDPKLQSLLIVFAGIAIVALIFWYLATEIEKRKRNIGTIAIAIVVGLCGFAIFPNLFSGSIKPNLKGGIDLVGGSSFIVEIKKGVGLQGEEIPVDPEAVQQAIATLTERLRGSGLSDNLLQPLGENRIIIEMPGVGDERRGEIKEIIERTARLELKEVHRQSNPGFIQSILNGKAAPPGYRLYPFAKNDPENEDALLPIRDPEGNLIEENVRYELLAIRTIAGGDMVDRASPAQQIGTVLVRLSSEGGDRVRNSTSVMEKGRDRMAVVLDGQGMVAPTVQATLSRDFSITGLDGREEVKRVVFALNNPLKNPLTILSERNVTPRLGEETVRQGISAALFGLALTFVFVLIYYRLAGIIALAGLTVNMLILFGAMAMFGATFTLAGIAGIVLTIGIAVDANVLIYERLREEMKNGKSLSSALSAAYEKAFSAIFDANITSLMTALILLWRASDQMKGFAITLTIGILASMFAALLATRVFFFWGRDTGLVEKLSFMDLAPKKTVKFLDMRKPAFMMSSVLFIGSLLVMGVKNDKALGIDFLGGSLLNIQLEADDTITKTDVEDSISDLTLAKEQIVQEETVPGADGSFITIKIDTSDIEQVQAELRKDIPALAEQVDGKYRLAIEDTTISASLGGEFFRNSIIALGIGLFAVLVYISLRFEFSFAVGAFAALTHDVVIALGVIILLGAELSLIHVGAILTIAGYSINDTIIIFDRIRETLRTQPGSIKEVMNTAINATLSRTILTSGTTFAAVLILYIFGGGAMRDFSLAIMIGVIIGTYSSIFIASPLVYLWSKMRGSDLRDEIIDPNLTIDEVEA